MPRAAVIGSPIDHSLSPVLHRAAYVALKLPDWTYTRIVCDDSGIKPLLSQLVAPEWAGLSVTMPLKRTVLDLADTRSDLAAAVGAANTLLLDGGRRHAENTDVGGLVDALREAGVDAPRSALILGAGGTAQAAVAAVAELGLTEVAVAVRDPARAGALCDTATRVGVEVAVIPWGSAAAAGWVDLLVSTVPAGAADALAPVLALRPSTTVFDVIYHPWPTPLAEQAKAAGARVVAGIDLLIHQAARQVELMTGRRPPIGPLRDAVTVR